MHCISLLESDTAHELVYPLSNKQLRVLLA
jgi:hypothetical protein